MPPCGIFCSNFVEKNLKCIILETKMIISRKSTFFLGIFIFIIPFLGFPSAWKIVMTCIAGIAVILMSLKVSIPKKSPRHKPREKVTPVFVESIPVLSPRNDTVEVISQVPIPEPAPKLAPRKSRASRKTNVPTV